MDTVTPQPAAPKRRRRFQFRLRTLFVLVTMAAVACGYVAHEYRIVRERTAMVYSGHWTDSARCYPSSAGKIPWLRVMLGDRAYSDITISQRTPEKDLEQYKALFPEAAIARYEDPFDPPITGPELKLLRLEKPPLK
jgi:hypothetical protein